MLTRDLNQDDFDQLSWHDNEIYSVEFRVGDPERGDWTSDLVLDIDYIVEWVRGPNGIQFSVAPATLIFHGATDLHMELASGTDGHQVSLTLPSIAAIERERVTDQKVFLDRPYYRWIIRLNGFPHGQIVFGAVGFTQKLRREPVLCDQPRLAPTLRGPR